MSVYFCRVGRYIKIGHSYDPCGRTSTYWFGAIVPFEVYMMRWKVKPEMLRVVRGGRPEEWTAHKALGEHRLDGEWFADCQAVRDFIATYGELEPPDPYYGPCGCGAHDSTLDARPPVPCAWHSDVDSWLGNVAEVAANP